MKSPSKCILVIEDEPFVRDIIATVLKEQGYDVAVADNGQEGFASLSEDPPDAIVCDILMPREDGIAFCRRVRDRGLKTPILFLSAKNQPESVVEGLSAGADDYLVKPFHLQELAARVAHLLKIGGPDAPR